MRNFEEIIVTYYPDNMIPYPEYKGKPYFSIQYEENGEHYVGYGTYNPQVLSNYIKDYFINVEEELEKIKAEIIACTQQEEGEVPACINYGIKLSTEIVEKHIKELKGEKLKGSK